MKRGYADTPEGQIHYLTAGQGEPLLLLAQGTRSSRSFERLIPFLAKQYCAIAVDTLGSGNSDPPPPNVQVHHLAQSVVHLMDALQLPRCHLFGNHTGATIAAEIAAGWPSRADRLVLFGYALVHPGKERVAEASERARGMARLLESAADGSHLARMWSWTFRQIMLMWWDRGTPPPADLTPDLHQFMNHSMLDKMELSDGFPAVYGAVLAYESERRLPFIGAPTLVIEGTGQFESDIVRRAGQVATLIRNCKAMTMEDVDGNIQWWQPERLAEVIVNFLGQD